MITPLVVPPAGSRMFLGILVAAGVVAAGFVAAPRVARAEPSPDSLAVAADSIDALRGTERPVPRRESTLRYAARGLLFVPYAAMRVATWPLIKLAEAEDRVQAVSRILDLLSFGYERGPFRSTLFFGYESSNGFSLVGLDATATDWPEAGSKLRLSGGYRSDDENLAAFRFRSAPRILQWETIVRLENKTRRPFHGLGPDSDEELFEADRRRLLFEATAALRPANGWKAAVTGYARRDHLRSSDESGSVTQEFPELFEAAKRSDYDGAEAELSWDTRDAEAFASRGSLVRVLGGTDLASSDGDADYRHWLGELQTHVNLWRGTRILALRALAEGVTANDPDSIPYTELVRLGGRKGLRGYPSDRFADRTGVLLTAEYHYPVTTNLQGNLFADWGTVASRFDELQLADVDPSVGLGLAYVVGDNAIVAHAARGGEGFEFYVGTETVFESRSRRLR